MVHLGRRPVRSTVVAVVVVVRRQQPPVQLAGQLNLVVPVAVRLHQLVQEYPVMVVHR